MAKYFYRLFNLIFLVALFGIFKNTPLYLIDKVLDVFCPFFCVSYLTHSFLVKRNEFYPFARKALFGYFALLIVSVLAATLLCHQKFLESLAAQLEFLQIFTLAFYAYAYKNRKLEVRDFEKYIKYFLILNLIIVVAFRNYVSTGTSLVGSHALVFKYNYLPVQFIRFGVIYFFVLFLKRGKYIYGLFCVFLLVFPNVMLKWERGYFFYTIMLMCLTVMLIRKSQRFFSKIIVGTFILLLLLVVAISFSGSFGASILTKYGDIISGVSQGSSGDASVNYRLKEIPAGLKLFAKDPLLGSGKLNSANSVIVTGIEYYPSDIGVIGILSTYGIVGVIVFVAVFI